jgi:hypothetical protein
VGDVEVEAGGAQTGMAEPQLEATQVDPGFEQMGRTCVPQSMRIHRLFQRGGVAGVGANMGHARGGDGSRHAGARQEPGLELRELPGAPQQRQEVRGEHHAAIAFPLALAHPDHQAWRVKVGALELTECGAPHARRIQSGEHGAMLEVARRQE